MLREGNFYNGYFHGIWKFYSNNALVKKTNYVNGIPDGLQQEFHPDGSLKASYQYKNGFMYGEAFDYYENKQVKKSTLYNKQGKRDGKMTLYFEDGSLEGIYNYKDGKNIGPTTLYYPSGALYEKEVFSADDRSLTTQYYESGSIRSLDYRLKNHKDSMFVYYPSGALLISESYDANNTGEENFYLENGEIFKIDVWKDGILQESKVLIDTSVVDSFNRKRVEISTKEELIFTIVEEMPRLKNDDCESLALLKDRELCAREALMAYLATCKYPHYTLEYDIETKVFVRFVIDEEGNVQNAQVVKSVNGNSVNSEQAVRHIESLPKWIPGSQRGKNVKVQYIVHINFKIN